MQQRSLGSTGLSVSRLGLGTMTWGRDTDEHEARAQLVAFVEAGGTLVDTAAGYTDGDSERADRLADRRRLRPRRDRAGHQGRHQPARTSRVTNASRGHLISTLDASLKRLGVDHVDLWQVHTWVDDAPLEETLSALDYAVTTGRASYVGVCNYAGWQSAQAATWQRAVPGRATLASNQVEYSLLNRAVEAEVVPAAQALGPRHPAVVAARPRRAHRQVPQRHPRRLPRRLSALLHLRGALPRRALAAGGRGGGSRGRRPGLVAARGRARLGARPARGHRPDHRRTHRRAAARVAGASRSASCPSRSSRHSRTSPPTWRRPHEQPPSARKQQHRALRPDVEYEFDKLLISREHSRNAVTRMLVELAEQGGWELDRVRFAPTAPDGYSCGARSSGSGSPTCLRLVRRRGSLRACRGTCPSTRAPNSSASTGTRSSTPWNSAVKSRSSGSRSGANPNVRMPRLTKCFASVPPLIRYGATRAPGSSSRRRRSSRPPSPRRTASPGRPSW